MIRTLLIGVLVPAGCSAALLALAARLWREESPARGERALWAPFLAAAFLAGHAAVAGTPPLPPVDAGEWLFYFVPLAAALSAIEALQKTPEILSRLSRAALVYGLFFLTFRPLIDMAWGRQKGAFLVLLLSLLVLSVWQGLVELGRSVRAPALSLSLLAAAACTASALALSGSALLGQLAGVLASALAPFALAALWRPARAPAGSLVAPFLLILGALLAQGVYYSALPAAGALVLLAAPLLCAADRLPLLARTSPRRAGLVTAAAVLAAGGACVLWVARHLPSGDY